MTKSKLDIQMTIDKVLLRIDSRETRVRKSGLVMPKQTAEAQTQFGEVLAVGPGKWNDACTARVPMQCKVGDRVLVTKSAGAGVFVNGELRRWVRDDDVIAIVPEDYNHDEYIEEDIDSMIKEVLKKNPGAQAG